MRLSLLLITFFSIIAYVPLIYSMGFYSEDFFFSYIGHFYGATGLINSLSIDRPFGGYLFALTYSLLGDSVILWHIFTFLVRLLGGYILFFTLLNIFPNKIHLATIATVLFITYPGFLQQAIPLGYHVHILGLTLYVLSLLFTVLAIKNKVPYKILIYTSFALILQILTFLNLEFFIGMEVFRILIITLILKEQISFASVKKTFNHWGPYILTIILFILWRVLIFKNIRPETDVNWVLQNYYLNPFWILKIPLEIIHSFFQTVIFAYFLPSAINFIRLPFWNSFFSLALGLCSASLLFYYFKKNKVDIQDKKLGKQFFLIGVIAIIGALIPIVLSGRFVREFAVYDRYTITSIIGVSFFIVGLLMSQSLNKTHTLIFFVVTLAITSHLLNGFYRVDYWNKQKDLWWQLYWRSPNIEKNAMLILNFPPLSKDVPFKDLINKIQWYRFYWAEEQIWSAGNLFFNYSSSPSDHFSGDFLQDTAVLKKIKEGRVETIKNRKIIYTRDFKNSVIISTPSDTSCLWVLDSKLGELPANADELLKSSVPYSNSDKLVKTDVSVIPPKQIFGNEPPHTWCYFFQKASLARQLKDWNKLSEFKKEVLEKNLKPKDPHEWLPFTLDLR